MLVLDLILTLDGVVQGFPDTTRKLNNVVRAWAAFMSLEPYELKINPQVAETMSEEDKARFAWKQGVIPGEWLITKVRDSCEWMPAPRVAREMYCAGGFIPRDGLTMDKLPSVGKNSMQAAELSEGDPE